MASLMEQVKTAFPESKWIQWEPVNRDNVRAGSQLAFGQYVETRYNLEKADIILSLDGDFLSSGYPGIPVLRAAVCGAARSRSQREDVALLLRSRARRPTPAARPIIACRCGRRKLRRWRARSPRAGRGRRRHHGPARASEVCCRGGERSAGAQGRGGGDSRRQSAAGGTRSGARHERRAGRQRQHRRLYRVGAGEAARFRRRR